MLIYGQGTKWRRKNAENFNRLSIRARTLQTDDRRTGDSIIIVNVNVSSRSLKTKNRATAAMADRGYKQT